ncbi:hypothetical protein [Microbacterium halophytorum]|uniref:hypothetical protein n=1 Tax=Microbacterium halophytorum TaxID=2067568 RepID=UPI000CFAC1C6|nr:hypothetical protein [Microbacterium halophytorum]
MSNDQQPDQPQQQPYAQGGMSSADGSAPRQPLPGHPQTPSHQMAAVPRPRGTRAGLAWSGLVLAVLALLAGPFVSAGIAAAFQTGSMDVAVYSSVIALANIGVVGTLALLGLILSCVALTGTKRVLTGIGIGANAAILLSIAFNTLLTPLAYSFI